MERLAAQDPANAGWQRDLGISHNRIGAIHHRIGRILEAQGDLAGALAAQEKTLAIMERLAAQDPANAGLQYDLSVSLYGIRTLEIALEDWQAAASTVASEAEVMKRLVALDPDNSGWWNEFRFRAACNTLFVVLQKADFAAYDDRKKDAIAKAQETCGN